MLFVFVILCNLTFWFPVGVWLHVSNLQKAGPSTGFQHVARDIKQDFQSYLYHDGALMLSNTQRHKLHRQYHEWKSLRMDAGPVKRAFAALPTPREIPYETSTLMNPTGAVPTVGQPPAVDEAGAGEFVPPNTYDDHNDDDDDDHADGALPGGFDAQNDADHTQMQQEISERKDHEFNGGTDLGSIRPSDE